MEPTVRTFLDGFRDQVELAPHAPAVTQERTTLTYGQLDRRSNALARHLRAAGAAPDALVGLMLERSPEMLVALLAILKTGAAYVPLDPAFPTARLALMVDDARPAAIVTESAQLDRLPADVNAVCLDRDAAAIADRSEEAIEIAQRGTCAYAIYTSGSTGRPKGVEITHASVLNLLESFRAVPGMRSSDVVLAHTTLSFDIAVIELWLPLFTGAQIVLAGRSRGTDGRAIADLLTKRQLTFMQATPSLWRVVLDAGWHDGRGLTALSGGEPLSRDLADALLHTGAEVWNVYGPTETTVWSSISRVTANGPVLIGHPIRDTRFHIVDEQLREVPEGEIGELCIGGAGVARGYLNRPDLTAERFVPDPFSREPGDRLYRTGDHARSRGSAGFECLGRIDHQIKIDGFRIEPGEIEAILSMHPSVRHSIVCAVDKAGGDRRLVAYVAHGSLAPPPQADLIALARTHLPSYMVPAAFVMLSELPRTPNGKLDRGALPAPDWSGGLPGRAAATPRTTIEERLLSMWRDVIGVEAIGIDDNFFDIGGRSRLGAQIFARIEREIGARLPLATLFEAPTIAALAREIETKANASLLWRSVVPIRATGSGAPVFCVHPVGGNVLAYGDLARRLEPAVACYGLQAVGLDGVAAPLTSVEAMARRYVEEIRSIQPRGPYHLCGFSFGGLVAFEMARRLRREGETVGLLALLDVDFPDYPRIPPFTWLSRSSTFRRSIFPIVQRARRHMRSLRRLGVRGYAKLAVRDAAVVENSDQFWLIAERVRKANTRAAIHYVPRWYDGRVTYFRAQHAGVTRDRRALWTTLARDVEIVDVAGGHSDLRLEPQVQIVAREILRRLNLEGSATRVA
ncbi:MAG TPA: amino acid adenylation domain-containing protein [Vicinamibacterales bacterium]